MGCGVGGGSLIAIFQYVTLYGTAVKVFLSDWEPYLGMYFRDLITLLFFPRLSTSIFHQQRYQTMSLTITVPNNYGWVVIGAGIVPVVTSMWLGGVVMKKRKEYDVKYPNL